MRLEEEESNWFSKWEEQLPSPEELMPLSQTLITPPLALAFDIPTHPPPRTTPPPPPSLPPPSSEFAADSSEMGSGPGGDEPARTLKRPRLVWTPQLHKRFVDAVAHLGIKNAVPKTIMQLMSVDGLTRENVASHLQKYRLYLKRMQGLSSGGGGGGGVSDPATERLFASSPVPPHFLHPSRTNSEQFLPFVNVAAMQHHHHLHHQQVAVGAGIGHPGLQGQYQMQGFGSVANGHFDHRFLSGQMQQQQQQQQQQLNVQRMGGGSLQNSVPGYVEDLESENGGRKVLTLFPTGED